MPEIPSNPKSGTSSDSKPKVQMTRKQRLITTVLLAVVIGGQSAYFTIKRNDRDYQAQPVASVLGSILPAVLLAPVAYWLMGRFSRRR